MNREEYIKIEIHQKDKQSITPNSPTKLTNTPPPSSTQTHTLWYIYTHTSQSSTTPLLLSNFFFFSFPGYPKLLSRTAPLAHTIHTRARDTRRTNERTRAREQKRERERQVSARPLSNIPPSARGPIII